MSAPGRLFMRRHGEALDAGAPTGEVVVVASGPDGFGAIVRAGRRSVRMKRSACRWCEACRPGARRPGSSGRRNLARSASDERTVVGQSPAGRRPRGGRAGQGHVRGRRSGRADPRRPSLGGGQVRGLSGPDMPEAQPALRGRPLRRSPVTRGRRADRLPDARMDPLAERCPLRWTSDRALAACPALADTKPAPPSSEPLGGRR